MTTPLIDSNSAEALNESRAEFQSDADFCTALLTKGGEYGWTVLHYVVFENNPELLAAALGYIPEADRPAALLAEDNKGYTVLDFVSYENNPELLRVVVDAVGRNSFANMMEGLQANTRLCSAIADQLEQLSPPEPEIVPLETPIDIERIKGALARLYPAGGRDTAPNLVEERVQFRRGNSLDMGLSGNVKTHHAEPHRFDF